MKITFIRNKQDVGKEVISTCEAEAFVERIKTETKEKHVTRLRAMLEYTSADYRGSYEYIDKLPHVCPSIEYKRQVSGERAWKHYNGIVMIEVNQLANSAEVQMIKQQAALLPQTWMAFAGSSGRSVKIWAKIQLPDGSLPQKEEEVRLFHAHAYRLAVQCYQPMLAFPITLKEPSPEDCFRMTLDEKPYFNPTSMPFCQEQPLAMPGEQTFRQRQLTEKNPFMRLQPGFETSHTFNLLFETALNKTFEEMEDWQRNNEDLQPLLICLADHCFKAGIPEEEVVRQVLIHYYRHSDEQTVRATIHNIYQESKGFGKKTALTPEQKTAMKLEEFMERRYEFRFNQLLNDLEYRQRDSIHFYFNPMDQRARNSVAMDALQEGIRVWDRDVNRYLSSNRVPLYNPVEEYLCNTGTWDGKDRIRALADLVPCKNSHWRELFYRWFLNMVAHWRGLDRMHSNSTSPLLVGPQGFRKSTFCRIILPPELRYAYTDSLDFKSKRDAEMSLSRFLLINLDEFDYISSSQQGFLKHLLQKPAASLRKPHGASIQEMRRYTSFIGTSNHKDLLTDTSGSRRFICIEVTAPIPTNATINYKQLYAQAMHNILQGERYWLDDSDEAVLHETNREFERVSPIEQLLQCNFRPAEEGEEGKLMSSMQILSVLHQKEKSIKLSASDLINIGRILKKNGIKSKRTNKGMLYEVIAL